MLPTINIFNVKIITFPIILILAAYVCIITLIKKDIYNSLCKSMVVKSLLCTLFFALLGGKLLYFIVMMSQKQHMTLKEIFFGGFVFYGGLIGGAIGLFIFSLSEKISFLDASDVLLSIIPLGQAIGRIGCFFNGCCYGIPYHRLFSVKYPINGEWCYVFPVWFAEAVICLILFSIIQKIITTGIRGISTGAYLIYYSIMRFILEFFRGDLIRGVWLSLSTSQIISFIGLIVGSIIIFISILNKKSNKMISKKGH